MSPKPKRFILILRVEYVPGCFAWDDFARRWISQRRIKGKL